MKNRIKIKNTILKEVANTKHQLERFKSRFNVLCQGDIENEDKMNILRNVTALNQLTLDNKSYAVRIGDFKVNKNSKYFIDVNGRGYYRVNDELFKDSTGNEFWAIVRNNVITTFMLRKDIQSRDVNHMKDRLRVDDVIFDISKVNTNEAVSEDIIDEDFESQKIIPTLAEDIIRNYLLEFVKRTYLTQGMPQNMLVSAFKGLKYKYGKLNDFVANFILLFELDMDIKAAGQFQHSTDGSAGKIVLRINPKIVYDYVVRYHKTSESKEELAKDVFYAMRNGNLLSVMQHELQHAYDYYISKGKFASDKQSQDYYKKKNAATSDMPQDSKDKLRTKYLRLKHEVNARFTQTMEDLSWEFKYNVGELIEPTVFMEKFKTQFAGWELMTPKIQKYLMRRASQYYYKYKEEYENQKKGE